MSTPESISSGAARPDITLEQPHTALRLERPWRQPGRPVRHVSLELGCMHVLCEAEAQAWERGDGPAAARAQQLQWRLPTEHLLEWVPALCRRIRANAPGPFYRGIADLTEALVRREAEAEAGPAGVPREVSGCE